MKKISIPVIVTILLLLMNVFYSVGQSNNLMVISNPKGAQKELTFAELTAIMKGEKQRWKDGTAITIALMKSSTSTGEAAAKKVYGNTGDGLNKYWLALVFQGKAKAPAFFNSPGDLEAFVSQTPGAIGIIEDSPEVKTKPLIIDGKKSF
ncbi:MAG: hypothetical protein NTV09_02450 [Bacteroidetes bacterium]|nr:hypothetical protein [Bacteroidota bacterium]